MTVLRPTPLRLKPNSAEDPIAELPAGAPFEALDFASGFAWGIAVTLGLVGYVARDSIAVATTG